MANSTNQAKEDCINLCYVVKQPLQSSVLEAISKTKCIQTVYYHQTKYD